MDPFVKITYNGSTYSTKVDNGGGKHPVWNETFIIQVAASDDQVKF